MKALVPITLSKEAPETCDGAFFFSPCTERPDPCAEPLIGSVASTIPNHNQEKP